MSDNNSVNKPQVSIDVTVARMLLAAAKQGTSDLIAEVLEKILEEYDETSKTEKIIPVVAALLKKNGKYLLARRKPHKHMGGLWEFPGGKVAEGESEKAGLLRQIREEMDVEVKVGHLLAQSTFQYADSPTLRVRLYACQASTDKFTFSDHDAARWMTLDEIDEVRLAPADRSLVNQLRTLDYYQREGEVYVADTRRVNLSRAVEAMALAVESGHILDVGSGSGRDSRYFLDKDYSVTALEFSPLMAKLARAETGLPVIVGNVLDIPFENKFDGIWASSCLPHLPKLEVLDALRSILKALKPGGAAYFSLKKGTESGLDDLGRYIARYESIEAESLISQLPGAEMVCQWEEEGAKRGSTEQWINVIFTKSPR